MQHLNPPLPQITPQNWKIIVKSITKFEIDILI